VYLTPDRRIFTSIREQVSLLRREQITPFGANCERHANEQATVQNERLV